MRLGRLLVGVAALVVATSILTGHDAGAAAYVAESGPLAPEDVPEPLRPWVDWVLRSHATERCTLPLGVRDGQHICVWATRLELVLGEHSGRFVQRWEIERPVLVPLPGDARHWPRAVTVDGRATPVSRADERPGVELEAGTHVVRGEFRWDQLPELLQVPPQTALLSLRLATDTGSEEVKFPNRDAQGRLWLRQRSGDTGEKSRLELLVHRRVIDDIPLRLETRIELEVSGRSREMLLGRALPPGFVPMSLSSPLPARLDPDGRLRVQVRPGRFEIQLTARHQGPLAELALHDPGGPWASSEVWVFAAKPDLRVVTVTGGTPIDPQQTNLPPAWKKLPAYLMTPGDSLDLIEKRRGDESPAPDLLALDRSWWLDFDGRGYTIQDRIEGEIRRSSRLEMAPATHLGRVELNGRDQFITRIERQGDRDEAVGIEVPRGAVTIQADSRVEDMRSPIPAVGWDHDFQHLTGRLHLPPGWRLLHASGVDRATSTWINRWRLLDIFAAVIIMFSFGRLWGRRWGAVAAVALALLYTEPDAPQWIWIALLIGEALSRAFPSGRYTQILTLYRGAAFAVLLLIGVPFAVHQVRVGLHPALEGLGGAVGTTFVRGRAAADREPAALEMPGFAAAIAPEQPPPMRSSLRAKGSYYDAAYQPDPGARVTTGPGLPKWAWREIGLAWSGPVTRAQNLSLILSPPWLTACFAFARVGLLAALAFCLLPLRRDGWLGRLAGRTAASALVATLATAVAGVARAEFPSDALLEELRSRLLAPPVCAPHCATAAAMHLDATPAELSLSLQIDAVAATAVPLPGGARSWLPAEVLVNGAPTTALRAQPDGVLWLRVEPGRHRVLLRGPLPDRDAVELPLPLSPSAVTASVTGWALHGLLDDHRAESTLQLTRVRETGDTVGDALEATGELPAFVEVVRQIRLGLTWQVQTQVRRLTPIQPAILLDVPLLAGEGVTTAGIRVEDGHARLALGPGIASVQWTSTLDATERLNLRAADTSVWREVWRLDVSPIWHVDVDGIPPVHQPSATAARVREWRPWPGESVSLDITRPAGVLGRTATVDASEITVTPGQRASDAELLLSLRSSRGGEHRIELPAGALLQSVAIDGITHPIRQDGREVTVPLVPGSQRVVLAWRQPDGLGLYWRSPAVDIRMESVNASLVVNVPESRWILAVGGPPLGPAVLFWSYLAVLLGVAFALGHVRLTPLRFRHWLLLGVGLTQASIAAAGIVVAWLLALGWRGSREDAAETRFFHLGQIALVGLTGAALIALLLSIRTGLLGLPEMQIAGNGSGGYHLRWYLDRADALLPPAWIVSVPVIVYRIAMLAWALWLTQALLRWLRWGWDCFSRGEAWRPVRLRRRPDEPASEPQ